MTSGTAMAVNMDLRRERQTATFKTEAMTEFLRGGRANVERRRHIQNVVFNDEYLKTFQNLPWYNRTREQEYYVSVKKSAHLTKIMEKLNITDWSDVAYLMEAASSQDVHQFAVNKGMYIKTIELLGTKQQIDKYGKPAMEFRVLGSYAQTELGHGTFIRGLETTATYDPSTEEFIINSPTLTSMKYWPGALGKTANFVVVVAQTYSQGKCHGIHMFVAQIRSLEDHTPLPGVTVGDIGNKPGMNGMDNGFLIFHNYRVPRDAMLMKHSRIEKDGTYVAGSESRLNYATMVSARSNIVVTSADGLARACTIAVRFSAVRHQSELKPGEGEPQIITYQTQQEKLFPALAAAYAFWLTGTRMTETYNQLYAEVEKGQTEKLQTLHATSAALKALVSYAASDAITTVRLACGGHGYSHAGGLLKLFNIITPACTYEGENTVMFLQCARYLIKSYNIVVRGQKASQFLEYLNKPVKTKSGIDMSCVIGDLLEAYEHVAARLIKVAALKIQSLLQGGMAMEEARNQTSVQLVRAAIAHSELFVVSTFVEMIKGPHVETGIRSVLQSLCHLHAVSGLLGRLGEFMQDGYISGQQADMLLEKQLALFREIRPNAVALVDAFDYPDQVLDSCLGRYDGNVYEALYEYAKNSPLNKSNVMASYRTTLRPLMKGKLDQKARL